ncbi:MAG: glycosyltransferase family 4 protein [Cyanophyceae cyanobacterium]
MSDLSGKGSGRWGGAVRPFLLAQALEKLGLEVEMLGVAFDDDTPVSTTIPTISFPCQYHSGFLRAARHLIQSISGEIVYAVKPKMTSFGVSLVKKLLSQRSLILDIDDWEMSWHGGDRWQYRPSLADLARDTLKPDGALRFPDHPLYLKWLENLVPYADAVTTHSQFLQKRFGGVYVPNGKDTELFSPQRYDPQVSRAQYGLADYRVLMFPGAPRPYKGLEDVLLALEQLNQPDLRLVIVGGSPYDDYDAHLAQRWGQWIVQLPKQPVQSMPAVVSAAHIVVVPQRDVPAAIAQFPLKLTDGMAMAKPVLATRIGDIPDILADTGYLVEPESPGQIAEQIQQIFKHLDEANDKGERARQRCIEHYSIERMANILSEVVFSRT